MSTTSTVTEARASATRREAYDEFYTKALQDVLFNVAIAKDKKKIALKLSFMDASVPPTRGPPTPGPSRLTPGLVIPTPVSQFSSPSSSDEQKVLIFITKL
jgi:hypothetical protein